MPLRPFQLLAVIINRLFSALLPLQILLLPLLKVLLVLLLPLLYCSLLLCVSLPQIQYFLGSLLGLLYLLPRLLLFLLQ